MEWTLEQTALVFDCVDYALWQAYSSDIRIANDDEKLTAEDETVALAYLWIQLYEKVQPTKTTRICEEHVRDILFYYAANK